MYIHCRRKSAVYKKRGMARQQSIGLVIAHAQQPDPHAGVMFFDSDIVDVDMLI